MKKTLILVIALVVIVAALAACGAANGVNGLWYEKTGFAGTMEFKSGGVVTMAVMGMTIDGTYTFDAAKSEGTITISVGGQGGTQDFKLADGQLDLGGTIYTREKVEQQDLGDLLNGLGN